MAGKRKALPEPEERSVRPRPMNIPTGPRAYATPYMTPAYTVPVSARYSIPSSSKPGPQHATPAQTPTIKKKSKEKNSKEQKSETKQPSAEKPTEKKSKKKISKETESIEQLPTEKKSKVKKAENNPAPAVLLADGTKQPPIRDMAPGHKRWTGYPIIDMLHGRGFPKFQSDPGRYAQGVVDKIVTELLRRLSQVSPPAHQSLPVC